MGAARVSARRCFCDCSAAAAANGRKRTWAVDAAPGADGAVENAACGICAKQRRRRAQATHLRTVRLTTRTTFRTVSWIRLPPLAFRQHHHRNRMARLFPPLCSFGVTNHLLNPSNGFLLIGTRKARSAVATSGAPRSHVLLPEVIYNRPPGWCGVDAQCEA